MSQLCTGKERKLSMARWPAPVLPASLSVVTRTLLPPVSACPICHTPSASTRPSCHTTSYWPRSSSRAAIFSDLTPLQSEESTYLIKVLTLLDFESPLIIFMKLSFYIMLLVEEARSDQSRTAVADK